MNKEDHINWLNENINVYLLEKEEEEGWIDKAQNAADWLSIGASFIPVFGQGIAAGIDATSAAIDTAQGQYGDAAFRGGMAALSAVPMAGGAAKTSAKLARAAGKAVGTAVKGAEAVKVAVKGAEAAKAASTVVKGAEAAKAVSAAEKAAVATKGAEAAAAATKGAATTATTATAAARTGSQAAQATAAATKIGTGAAKVAKTTSTAYKAGRLAGKAGKFVGKYGKYGAIAGLAYNALSGGDGEAGGGAVKEYKPSYLDPVQSEVRSNVVNQVGAPTNSEKRRDRMDPAFGYYGAQQMFRPIGYGVMQENTLNKMVNNHVNKFLKSRQGKKLKSEVSSITKKID